MRVDFKTVLILAVASYFLSNPSYAGETKNKFIVHGTFKKVEQGDYTHVLIVTDAGKEESFLCGKGCQPFIDNPKKFARKKLSIEWKEFSPPEDPDEKLREITRIIYSNK
jgi:hypothetical protein